MMEVSNLRSGNGIEGLGLGVTPASVAWISHSIECWIFVCLLWPLETLPWLQKPTLRSHLHRQWQNRIAVFQVWKKSMSWDVIYTVWAKLPHYYFSSPGHLDPVLMFNSEGGSRSGEQNQSDHSFFFFPNPAFCYLVSQIESSKQAPCQAKPSFFSSHFVSYLLPQLSPERYNSHKPLWYIESLVVSCLGAENGSCSCLQVIMDISLWLLQGWRKSWSIHLQDLMM